MGENYIIVLLSACIDVQTALLITILRRCHFQEASVIFKVTLKKESGSEPVEGVKVMWELFSPDGSESLGKSVTNKPLITPKNGLVGPIKLKVNSTTPGGILLDEDSQLQLKTQFIKQSHDTSHTFLCEDETKECPKSGFVTYLSHLDFRELVHVADATTVRMRGRVFAGQKSEGVIRGTECALSGVEVCLHRHQGPTLGSIVTNCDKTGDFLHHK